MPAVPRGPGPWESSVSARCRGLGHKMGGGGLRGQVGRHEYILVIFAPVGCCQIPDSKEFCKLRSGSERLDSELKRIE